MRFVIAPGTVVDVSIGMDEPAAAVRLVGLSVALINAAVRPDLIAFAVFFVLADVTADDNLDRLADGICE